jgi:hypothetical protein
MHDLALFICKQKQASKERSLFRINPEQQLFLKGMQYEKF